jgi:proton-dependent oligopeptide transporter, POT family
MAEKTEEKPAIARANSLEKVDHYSISESAISGVLEGSEGVTQHDLDTLRHVSDKFPMAAWLVVIVEFAER